MSSGENGSASPAQEYMRTEELAAYTGLSERFWHDLRWGGGGPPYVKPSKKIVLYRRTDVDAWMASKMRHSSFDDRPVVPA